MARRPQDDVTARGHRATLCGGSSERVRFSRASPGGQKKRKDRRTTPIVVEHGQCFIRALSVHNITQLARSAVPSF